jgi:ubiquitin-conjugating enzyme E2 Z
MTSTNDKRILRELKSLEESKQDLIDNGIYFYYDETNFKKIYTMFLGQKNTPYENGFYFITFDYPEKYPMQPPIAKYETQGFIIQHPTNKSIPVRFNPNLYSCGKVCLSMLNTWQGPGWTPANTIHNVLIAIQSLVLNENPLQNEPGFENASKTILDKYNNIIYYSNIKIAVLELVDNLVSNNFDENNNYIKFKDIIINNFIKNIEYYRSSIISKSIELDNKIVDSSCYGMSMKFNFNNLLEKFEDLVKKVNEKK